MPSLLEAIELKYSLTEDAMFSDGHEDGDMDISIYVPKKPPRICIPSLLVLNDFDIETAGDGHEIEDKCAGVEELDLAMNKLQQWSEVISIFAHMPRLKFANLSFNTLSTPLDQSQELKNGWSQLTNLVLNSTNIDWRSVRQLLRLLPCLEELHLSFNDYNEVNLEDIIYEKTACKCTVTDKICLSPTESRGSNFKDAFRNENVSTANSSHCETCYKNQHENDELNDPTLLNELIKSKMFTTFDKDMQVVEDNEIIVGRDRVVHPHIKKLHFTGNPVTDWSEICKLGKSFPNLESLVLADCPVESLAVKLNTNNIDNGSCSSIENELNAPYIHFMKLSFLNLNGTQLSSWDEIERLARFPKLQCLRIQGCPLWESHENTQHERRQLLVARLPNVTILNGGGVITAEEREAAERAFIRYYMDRAVEQRPARYGQLIALHGDLEPLANVDMRPEKRVRVKFTYENIIEERLVDVYRTVADLKTRLEPMTGLPPSRMRLFYVDQDLKSIQGPEEMKYASKQLYSYNIQSGDEIIIDQKRRTISTSSSNS